MILSAYPTMGKTTLTKKRIDIIDLESSCFDKANPNWYIDYCNTALDLEKQGYIVFVSSHKPVQEFMKKHAKNYIMLMYDISLKDYVIEKCVERYALTSSEKDFRALTRVQDNFESDYQAIYKDDTLDRMFISDPNYVLEDIVDDLARINK